MISSPHLFQYANYLPVERSAKPTKWLTQKYGDVILTDWGKPGWYVYPTAPKVGYASLNQATIVKASTVDDSVTAKIVCNVKICDNITGDYRWLPVGMNVVIAAAGNGGADLRARVLANDGNKLMLDTPAGTSQNAANVTYEPLTLS
jgi:hypothetical protein